MTQLEVAEGVACGLGFWAMSTKMLQRISRLGAALCASAAVGLAGAAAGSARTSEHLAAHASHHGPLSGDWSGFVSRKTSYGAKRQHITISINAAETGGTWRLSGACYGRLTLHNISSGYHHYLRHAAAGATCAGGDIDCLKRAGAGLYDSVTSDHGASWDTNGTLKRV